MNAAWPRAGPDPRLEEAHRHCGWHRDEVLGSRECGCFYCLEVFFPKEIEEWVDDEATALCPRCGIDSVIGSRSGLLLTHGFLAEMKSYWFKPARVVPFEPGEEN